MPALQWQRVRRNWLISVLYAACAFVMLIVLHNWSLEQQSTLSRLIYFNKLIDKSLFNNRTINIQSRVTSEPATIKLTYMEATLRTLSWSKATSHRSRGHITVHYANISIAGSPKPDKYFVNTTGCRMRWVDPFERSAMHIYKTPAIHACTSDADLITVHFDEQSQRYRLQISQPNISCCYNKVLRAGHWQEADMHYKLLPCSNFHNDFVLPKHIDAIITQCQQLGSSSKPLQVDAFSFVQPRLTKKKQEQPNNTEHRKPSVLLWGIDSMSRMNFERSMPLLHKYLQEHQWYELQGYNKVGDDAYDNWMALLSGYDTGLANKMCQPNEIGGLNSCPLLWNLYKNHGYITAFGEDLPGSSAFNYLKKGFYMPPTDYYLRPLMLAIESKLSKLHVEGAPFCVGRRSYAEYVYNFGVQFTQAFKQQLSFGMFWSSSFSRHAYYQPASMDAKMLQYMHTLDSNGIMNNSVIILLSDHGMRHGPLRKLRSGYQEERLPLCYIWLPHWFRAQHGQLAQALQLNRQRLTSPYDIYATLKHLLHLYQPTDLLLRPDSCPDCQSVLFELPASRNCSGAGIKEHWCTCNAYQRRGTSSPVIRLLAHYAVKAMNILLARMQLSHVCSNHTLHRIISAASRQPEADTNLSIYRLQYQTLPQRAIYEATLVWDNEQQKILVKVGQISRLDDYEMGAKCVNSSRAAKMFCMCRDKIVSSGQAWTPVKTHPHHIVG